MKKAHNTQIHLDERLYLCAKNVRLGSTVADIGADHAYIAIWLILNEVCPRAIATDLRSGPLMNAQKNIFKYGVADKIEARISDGLDAVFPAEVEDIIIAGMGGELIMQIIARAGWLRDPTKHLVLQPKWNCENSWLLRNLKSFRSKLSSLAAKFTLLCRSFLTPTFPVAMSFIPILAGLTTI